MIRDRYVSHKNSFWTKKKRGRTIEANFLSVQQSTLIITVDPIRQDKILYKFIASRNKNI